MGHPPEHTNKQRGFEIRQEQNFYLSCHSILYYIHKLRAVFTCDTTALDLHFTFVYLSFCAGSADLISLYLDSQCEHVTVCLRCNPLGLLTGRGSGQHLAQLPGRLTTFLQCFPIHCLTTSSWAKVSGLSQNLADGLLSFFRCANAPGVAWLVPGIPRFVPPDIVIVIKRNYFSNVRTKLASALASVCVLVFPRENANAIQRKAFQIN